MEAYIICLVSLVILNRTSAELSGTLQIAPGPFSDTMISIFIGLDTFELFSRGIIFPRAATNFYTQHLKHT